MQDLADPYKRVVGLKQVLRGTQEGIFKKVYIASDADQVLRLKLLKACSENTIEYDETYTMTELGNACTIDVGAATAGLLK